MYDIIFEVRFSFDKRYGAGSTKRGNCRDIAIVNSARQASARASASRRVFVRAILKTRIDKK